MRPPDGYQVPNASDDTCDGDSLLSRQVDGVTVRVESIGEVEESGSPLVAGPPEQPSELAKPIIILWVAYQLTNMDPKFKNLFYLRRAMSLPLVCCFFIYLQPDYGTTVTIFGILLAQIIFSRIDFK